MPSPAPRPSTPSLPGPDRSLAKPLVGLRVQLREYDPFGTIRDESGPARSEFGYADEQRDSETGLVNLRARYYEPGLGRFLSRDAFGGLDADPQGWNRYSYVENNPITRTDPSGHYGRGLPNAQVRALQQDWRAGRFSSESLAQIRRLTKDQYRWATAGLPRGVKKRLDRIAEPNEKEDDSKRSRLRKSCGNPGQYTGSCPGGPPNPAYIADQLAAERAKILGRAAQQRREAADNATVHAETAPDDTSGGSGEVLGILLGDGASAGGGGDVSDGFAGGNLFGGENGDVCFQQVRSGGVTYTIPVSCEQQQEQEQQEERQEQLPNRVLVQHQTGTTNIASVPVEKRQPVTAGEVITALESLFPSVQSGATRQARQALEKLELLVIGLAIEGGTCRGGNVLRSTYRFRDQIYRFDVVNNAGCNIVVE